MDDPKPRHIRDIAHLYLSRMPAKTTRHTIWVVATSKGGFGAFHAANLALGVARRGHTVELVEASGVLPCAAYFLRLPPRIYLKHKADNPQESLSALGGVTIRFAVSEPPPPSEVGAFGVATGPGVDSRPVEPGWDASQPHSPADRGSWDASQPHSPADRGSWDASQPHSPADRGSWDASQPRSPADRGSWDASQPRGARSGVELVHLPPAGNVEALRSTIALAKNSAADGPIQALILAPDDAEAVEAGQRLFDKVPGIRWSTLALDRRSSKASRAAAGRGLGYLVGWRQQLTDPVPCVLRDPESHVSRSYLSICDVLLSPGINAKDTNDRSSRIRSAFLGQSG